MNESVLEGKSCFKVLVLSFSFKLDSGSYISIAKTASENIKTLIHSTNFLSLKVGLYFHKSTIQPCMEYCGHVWAGAPSCCLELLDKLQKSDIYDCSPSLAASLEPLAHHRNALKK